MKSLLALVFVVSVVAAPSARSDGHPSHNGMIGPSWRSTSIEVQHRICQRWRRGHPTGRVHWIGGAPEQKAWDDFLAGRCMIR